MAPLPCSACGRSQTIAHKPAEHRMGGMPGFARLSLWEIASRALGERWVPWEVGDGSLRWTLEPPSGGQWEVRLAWRWRRLRDALPNQSMQYPLMCLQALLGTGWRAVTVGGIHPGVRHHELRAETPRENPKNPARRWPRPRHG